MGTKLIFDIFRCNQYSHTVEPESLPVIGVKALTSLIMRGIQKMKRNNQRKGM